VTFYLLLSACFAIKQLPDTPTPSLSGWWEQSAPCPEGAFLQGAAPPVGARIWCEIQDTGLVLPHGPETGFWADGSTRYERLWNTGRYDGEYKAWYPGGRLEVEGRFQADQQVGTWRWWYESGGIKTVDSFDGGVLNGTSIRYYENGKKAFERPYQDGLLHGTAYAWNDEGLLLGTLVFEQGSGDFVEWRGDGSLVAKGTYVQGAEQGEWRWFGPGGVLSSVEHYQDGVMNGAFSFFDPQGQELGQFEMDNGTGLWSGWHDNGQLAAQGTMVQEMRHGTWHYYDESGQPLMVQVWEQDRVVGEGVPASVSSDGDGSVQQAESSLNE
jgi:antitoxin component YwqK of YwqJK toxin-antitoxin module